MYNCIYLSKRYFIRRFYHLKLKRKQRAFSRFLSFFVVAEQPRKQRMFDDVKMKKKEKKKILNIYRILLILYTCACTYSGEIGGEGGEESIGRESNYVLLKLNVIDIMHSYFRVIRALQPRSDSPRYTFPFSPFPFVKNHRQRQGTSISIQIDICSNQTASLVSSFLPFFPSSPSFFPFLVESVLIPNAVVVKVTESGAMITMDGWMDGWNREYGDPRIKIDRGKKSGTKCFHVDLAFQVTSAETCVYLMKNRSRCFFTIRDSEALIMINRIND